MVSYHGIGSYGCFLVWLYYEVKFERGRWKQEFFLVRAEKIVLDNRVNRSNNSYAGVNTYV